MVAIGPFLRGPMIAGCAVAPLIGIGRDFDM